jgi:hypothetical protein
MTPTTRQSSILQWLGKVYPHAGRLFESALWVFANEDIPCRGRMIGHAYREICSELMNRYSPQSHEYLKPLLDDFADEFGALDLVNATLGPVAASIAVENEPGGITVPRTFVGAAERVVKRHRSEPAARQRAILMFAECVNSARSVR